MGPELGPPDDEELAYPEEDRSWLREWEHSPRRSMAGDGRPLLGDLRDARYAWEQVEAAYAFSPHGDRCDAVAVASREDVASRPDSDREPVSPLDACRVLAMSGAMAQAERVRALAGRNALITGGPGGWAWRSHGRIWPPGRPASASAGATPPPWRAPRLSCTSWPGPASGCWPKSPTCPRPRTSSGWWRTPRARPRRARRSWSANAGVQGPKGTWQSARTGRSGFGPSRSTCLDRCCLLAPWRPTSPGAATARSSSSLGAVPRGRCRDSAPTRPPRRRWCASPRRWQRSCASTASTSTRSRPARSTPACSRRCSPPGPAGGGRLATASARAAALWRGPVAARRRACGLPGVGGQRWHHGQAVERGVGPVVGAASASRRARLRHLHPASHSAWRPRPGRGAMSELAETAGDPARRPTRPRAAPAA